MVKLQEYHSITTAGAFQRVVSKRKKERFAPSVKSQQNLVFFFRNRAVKPFVLIAVSSIDAIISDHLKVLLGDVLYQAPDKFKGGYCLCDKGIVLVPTIVEGDRIPIVIIDTGRGDNRPAQIPADIFGNSIRLTFLGFRIDIETVFTLVINGGFCLFERITDMRMHLIQQGGEKSVAQESKIEVFHFTPGNLVASPTFRNEAVDMGIPFERTTESMEDADKAGSECFGLVELKEHTKDNASYS